MAAARIPPVVMNRICCLLYFFFILHLEDFFSPCFLSRSRLVEAFKLFMYYWPIWVLLFDTRDTSLSFKAFIECLFALNHNLLLVNLFLLILSVIN